MHEKIQGIVYEHGINDMPRGWIKESKWNYKVYKKWSHMLERIYSEKFHEKSPTYINCTLCLEWHWLSKFAEDIKNIDGYDEEKFLNNELELDKDIKFNKNKEYNLKKCKLVSKHENISFSSKGRILSEETRNNISKRKKGKNIGKENPNYKDYVVAIVNDVIIEIFESASDVERKTGLSTTNICKCCNGKRIYSGRYIDNKIINSRKNIGNKIKWKWLKDVDNLTLKKGDIDG